MKQRKDTFDNVLDQKNNSDDNSDDVELDKGSSMDDSEEETEEEFDLASLHSDDIALCAILQGKLNPMKSKIYARVKVVAPQDSHVFQPAAAVDGTTLTSTTPKKRGRPSGAVNRNICTPVKHIVHQKFLPNHQDIHTIQSTTSF